MPRWWPNFGRSRKPSEEPLADLPNESLPPIDLVEVRHHVLEQTLGDVRTAAVVVLGERGTGKSRLANATCGLPMFALNSAVHGVLWGAPETGLSELIKSNNIDPPIETPPALVFAEYGSDSPVGPADMEAIVSLLQVAAAVVVYARVEASLSQWLQRWLAFVPAVAKLQEDRGCQEFGHLFVVVRDWEQKDAGAAWEAKAAADIELWRMESMPPGVAGSDEEQRNVIRHHVKKAFASASAHFLPPLHRPSDNSSASSSSSARDKKVSSEKANSVKTSPEFMAAFTDFVKSMFSVITKPRFGDSGEALTGSVISRMTANSSEQEGFDVGLQSDRKDLAARHAVDTHLRAVAGFHEDRAHGSCQIHLQQVRGFIEHHLRVPLEPVFMERRFAECLKQTLHSFRGSIHSSTPEGTSQHFERHLQAESEAMLQELQLKNSTCIQELQEQLMANVDAEVQLAWASLPQPQAHEILKTEMDRRALGCLNRQLQVGVRENPLVKSLGGSKSALAFLQKQLHVRLASAYAEVLRQNEVEAEGLLRQESEAVKQKLQPRFRELEGQASQRPFPSPELHALRYSIVKDATSEVARRLEGKLMTAQIQAFCRQLSTDLEHLFSSCISANISSINSHVATEVDECLDLFRYQMIQPKVQEFCIIVSAELRELQDLKDLYERTPPGLASSLIEDLRELQDFVAPFLSIRFLEQAFIHALLERAEFLCEVCGFSACSQLPRGRAPFGRNGVAVQKTAKGAPENKSAVRAPGEAPHKVVKSGTKDGASPSSNSWAHNIPSHVRGLQSMETPAQRAMEFLLRADVRSQAVSSSSDGPAASSALDPESTFSGPELPRALAQFQVLSVEAIDQITSSLKQMSKDETADLSRRQQQRDEIYQLLAREKAARKKQKELEQEQLEQRQKQQVLLRQQQQKQELQERQQLQELHQRLVEKEMNLQSKEKELQNMQLQLEQREQQQQPENAGMESKISNDALSVTFAASPASPARTQGQTPKDQQHRIVNEDSTRVAQLELEMLQLRHLVAQQQSTIATQQVSSQLQRAFPEDAKRPVVEFNDTPEAHYVEEVDDHDEEHRRRKSQAPKHSLCGRCGMYFLASKNHPMACRSHPGRWVTPPNHRTSVLRSAAAQVVMGPQSKYHVESSTNAPGKWTCCDSRIKDDPGCVAESHVDVNASASRGSRVRH